MLRRASLAAAALAVASLRSPLAAADLCVAENGGHGEDPPPMGDLVQVNASGHARRVVAKGLQDPVWVVADALDVYAYVGLFHAGEVVRVELSTVRAAPPPPQTPLRGSPRLLPDPAAAVVRSGLDDDGGEGPVLPGGGGAGQQRRALRRREPRGR